MAKVVGKLSPQEFLDLIGGIRQMAFSKEVRSVPMCRANESSTEGSAPEDEEFTNHVRFLQEMETYCTLKHATTLSKCPWRDQCIYGQSHCLA